MSFVDELAALFERDLTRLLQQLHAFAAEEPVLWETSEGTTNSAGNLTLHLEGNLREYVGRLLGGLEYRRTRPEEFARKGVPLAELVARIEDVRRIVPGVIR